MQVTAPSFAAVSSAWLLNLLRLLQDSLLLMLKGFEIPGVRLRGESFGNQEIPRVTVRDLDCFSRLAERFNILP